MRKILLAMSLVLLLGGVAHAGVTLSWTDNSDNEEGFYIYKRAAGVTEFVRLGEVGANVTTFVDGLGSAGDCYQVSSFAFFGADTASESARIPTNGACALFSPGNVIIILTP